jgi:hypothetical protein
MKTPPQNRTSKTRAWQWHCGLISLRDVQTYMASRLVSINQHIERMARIIILGFKKGDEEKIKHSLSIIIKECGFVGLNFTQIAAQRILNAMDSMDDSRKKASEFIGMIDLLEERFNDEIHNLKFFLVKPDRLFYYENTEHAGEQFKTGFPRGNVELIEAGNCFALDRYTACVVHLMRSLEVALAVLHRSLDIPEPEKGAEKSWGRILSRILKKITENDSNQPFNWKREKEFYHQCYALFSAVKVPYRDSTMHVESIYDEQSAIDVFNVTTAALRYMATKLSENN